MRWGTGHHVVQLRDGARRGVLARPVLGVIDLDEVAVVAFDRETRKLNRNDAGLGPILTVKGTSGLDPKNR